MVEVYECWPVVRTQKRGLLPSECLSHNHLLSRVYAANTVREAAANPRASADAQMRSRSIVP